LPNSISAHVAAILVGDNDVAEGEVAANLALALRGEQAWNTRRDSGSSRNDYGLGDFLSHVVRTVPFYRSWLTGRSPHGTPQLREFPLTSRRDLEIDRDRFISDLYAEDAGVYQVPTSGSLGPRLAISYDLASSYGANYASYAAVAAVVPGLWDCLHPAGPGVVLLDNGIRCQAMTLFLPSLNYSLLQRFCLSRRDEDLAEGIDYLRRQRIPLLYGKPHYLLELADMDRRLGAAGSRLSAHAVLVSGENLYEDQRARIEAWFGGSVYNAYMSAEGGFIGLECRYRNGLHVQPERVILEVLAADQTVSDEGSGELVLTSLANWAMGFVRYRTGDHGTMRNVRCACGFCGPTLIDFPGRDATRFLIPSGRIEARSLHDVFAPLPVQQFQIVQSRPDTFDVVWVPDSPEADNRYVEHAIRRGLLQRLGDVALSVETVSRIVPPPGGKVRRYVCKLA
jgi:phenylacetate-coenzyme A ligase PaaK-like adenylate-forming protein